MISRLPIAWSPPPELTPLWDTYAAGFISSFFSAAPSADACAAFFVRAVMDPVPALRYMTHPPSEELMRTKVADLDGAGVAAATLAMVAVKPSGDGGSTAPPAAAERADE